MRHRTFSTSPAIDPKNVFSRQSGERGAVLIHVAIALVGLMAFSTLVVDYGVLWAARRQAQNAADAAAMAGAVSMGFVDFQDKPLARTAAVDVATRNFVWGSTPDVVSGDVTFPACPPGSPAAGSDACIRVNVFRNERTGGNPLPTFFGKLVGVNQQGVRATATAEVLFGDSATCVKPWAIPDKWLEQRGDVAPPGFDPGDDFERYANNGSVLNPADFYEPAGPGASNNGLGTGYTRDSVVGDDYGLQIVLKTGNNNKISASWHNPVVLDCTGANCYRDAISGCSSRLVGPGTVLEVEPGNMVGPTRQGGNDLYDQDPSAYWDPAMNNGKGGIAGGCMAAGTCTKSPRLVAIPVFNPDTFELSHQTGRTEVTITKILGFFVESRPTGGAAQMTGRLMTYPDEPRPGSFNPNGNPGASWVVSLALVR